MSALAVLDGPLGKLPDEAAMLGAGGDGRRRPADRRYS